MRTFIQLISMPGLYCATLFVCLFFILPYSAVASTASSSTDQRPSPSSHIELAGVSRVVDILPSTSSAGLSFMSAAVSSACADSIKDLATACNTSESLCCQQLSSAASPSPQCYCDFVDYSTEEEPTQRDDLVAAFLTFFKYCQEPVPTAVSQCFDSGSTPSDTDSPPPPSTTASSSTPPDSPTPPQAPSVGRLGNSCPRTASLPFYSTLMMISFSLMLFGFGNP